MSAIHALLRLAPRQRHVALGLFCAFAALRCTSLSAQMAMPDPKQMSGIPREVGTNELPAGSVSVRVIRGALTNNIANQPVELHVGDKVQTLKTDDAGRVQFDKLPAGASLQAITVVDGERLESQVFPAPTANGIRVMLVATDKEKAARDAAAAAAPAISGQVTLGGESRIILEPDDEVVRIFYFFDVVNNASAPVNPPSLFTFDMPTGSGGVTLFEDSSKQAAVNGTHVRVNGPFMPGTTSFQVAATLPVMTGTLEIEQKLPATWEQPLFVVKKFGKTTLSSPQIVGQQDMPEQGAFMAGGNRLEAGQPLRFTLSNLPHHSTTPRWIALSASAAIVLLGVWAFVRRPASASIRDKDERKRLIARREKLFQDLVRLEQEQRSGKIDAARYGGRREELMAALERVYGALDSDETGPGSTPTDRAGLAA